MRTPSFGRRSGASLFVEKPVVMEVQKGVEVIRR
jgi:hypothetical protein